MTAVTIKSDKARLTMKTRPASLPVAPDRCRCLTRCLMITVVMTTRLPRVPTTAATPSTPTYGAARTGLRLYNDPAWPTAASALFVWITPISGNSIVSWLYYHLSAFTVNILPRFAVKHWKTCQQACYFSFAVIAPTFQSSSLWRMVSRRRLTTSPTFAVFIIAIGFMVLNAQTAYFERHCRRTEPRAVLWSQSYLATSATSVFTSRRRAYTHALQQRL